MRFAQRDSEGVIIGYFSNPNRLTDTDKIDEQSAEWLAYLAPDTVAIERAWRDTEIIRVREIIEVSEDIVGAYNAVAWRTYRIALRGYDLGGTRPTEPV